MSISLKNKDMVIVHRYLTGKIDREEMAKQLHRTRTNAYYYIGRCAHYWLKKGILKFKRVSDDRELGGTDL